MTQTEQSVEAVARAICAFDQQVWDDLRDDDPSYENRADYRGKARAAIAAIPSQSPASADACVSVPDGLRQVLADHYLVAVHCDHEAKTDRAQCSCSEIRFPERPSVAQSVNDWVDHIIKLLGARPATSGPEVRDGNVTGTALQAIMWADGLLDSDQTSAFVGDWVDGDLLDWIDYLDWLKTENAKQYASPSPPQGVSRDAVLTEIRDAFEIRYKKDGIITSTHTLHNLEGAIIDIERNGEADAVSLRTLHRVAEQLARIERALKTKPTPEPVVLNGGDGVTSVIAALRKTSQELTEYERIQMADAIDEALRRFRPSPAPDIMGDSKLKNHEPRCSCHICIGIRRAGVEVSALGLLSRSRQAMEILLDFVHAWIEETEGFHKMTEQGARDLGFARETFRDLCRHAPSPAPKDETK